MKTMISQMEQQYRDQNAWGLSTSIDIYECNPDTIRSAEKIKEFAIKLCNLLDVKRFGECVVVHFGEDDHVAGYSMTQLIETSLVSGHFANKTNAAYIDVFSCKFYEPDVAANFAKEFFEGKSMVVQSALRRNP